MTPADTLALTADRLSALLRDTIRERVQAAQNGEQMRADVLGEDVQAIRDVIAYEADVIAGERFWVWGEYVMKVIDRRWDTWLWLGVLDRLICPGCDVCAGAVAA